MSYNLFLRANFLYVNIKSLKLRIVTIYNNDKFETEEPSLQPDYANTYNLDF